MWLLKDNSGKSIYLQSNKVFTIGRRTGSLVLNDESVSRRHAEIKIVPENCTSRIPDDTEPSFTCTITDLGSKYGTFLLKGEDSESRITEPAYRLQNADKIRFGVQQSIFEVTYVPIITATSGLEKDERNTLLDILNEIDGKITAGWQTTCTFMTISKPTISEKLTCALAYGTPIVPIEYWKHVLKAFRANEQLPDPTEYAKLIDKKLTIFGNISVRPNPLRKTIFNNLTFLHYDSNQYNIYRRMIETAGGKSVLYGPKWRKDIDVCADNVIVMQLVESNVTQATGTGDANYAIACQQLGECRRRAIPTSEIALAIFHHSTSKYCNPKYDHAAIFKKKTNNYTENSSVLALDTQDVDPPSLTHCKKITPDKDESSSRNVYIIESIEGSSEIESQLDSVADSANIGGQSRRDVNLPIDDSQSRYDEASIKVASLNKDNWYEASGQSVDRIKRDREEEDRVVEATKKKMCLGFSNVEDESVCEDIVSIEKKQNLLLRDLAETRPESEAVTSNQMRSLADTFTSRQESPPKMSIFDDTSRKRKAENKKINETSPKKMRKLPEKQTTLTKFLSTKKNTKEKVCDSLSVKSEQMECYGEPHNAEASMRLLRIRSPIKVNDSTVPIFRKCFQKVCVTSPPRRLRFNDMTDPPSPNMEENNRKQRASSDEEASTSRKISSSNERKKMLRM